MMNASELTQRRRLCTLARARQCTPSSARTPVTQEFRAEELAVEYPCLPAPITAPRIDFDSVSVSYEGSLTTDTEVSYSFSWGCVPGATHYKVFIRGPSYNNYINVGVPPTHTGNFKTVSNVNPLMFSNMSPLLTSTTYSGVVTFNTGPKLNLFVFAYRNGHRSDIPCTQLCLYFSGAEGGIEASLWPVVTQEIVGGPGFDSSGGFLFDTITIRDRYTKVSSTLTSEYNGYSNNYYPEEVVGATAIASAIF
jgi:hypothetical protein